MAVDHLWGIVTNKFVTEVGWPETPVTLFHMKMNPFRETKLGGEELGELYLIKTFCYLFIRVFLFS